MPTEGTSSRIREQWKNPSDILSVLLIVGPEVVSVALAQFYGSPFKPVAFSFGWVAYAYIFLLNTAGRLKLRPDPDFSHILVRCGTEPRVFENASWLLGRILKHYELWMPREAAEHTERLSEITWQYSNERSKPGESVLRPSHAGLTVAVFEPSKEKSRRRPSRDKLFWSGIVIPVIQAGIAAIPWGLYGEWEILVITACGTGFAFLMGALLERSLFAQTDKGKIFALTRGRGYQDVIVIVGNGHGGDLEDLASDRLSNDISYSAHYRLTIFACVMVAFWTALLITTSGIESNTWYLMAIGALGMLQNIYAAGAGRQPDAYGIHLDFLEVVGEPKVMSTLYALEDRYPTVGSSLLPILFSGALRSDEVARWEKYKKSLWHREEVIKADREQRKRQHQVEAQGEGQSISSKPVEITEV